MKVNFVILTWNSQHVIENCLNALIGFRQIPVCVYVVDNGSTDRTVELVEGLQAANPQTELLLTKLPENRGTTVPRNIALRQIMERAGEDEYVCVLDSDTEVSEAAMETLIRVLEDDPRCGVVGPMMRGAGGEIQQSGRAIPTATEKLLKVLPLKRLQEKGEAMQGRLQEQTKGTCPVGYLMSACWMMRVSLLDKVGLLDERIFYAPEDVEFCIRVWKSGMRVLYCSEAQILHHWQRLSRKKLLSKHNFEHIKGLLYMFRKHGFLLSAKKIESIMF